MFETAISSIVSVVIGIAILYIVYVAFISDWIETKRFNWAETKAKQSTMDKVSMVKLVSNDPEEIEKFVTINAQYLSVETVKKLVARIESLQDDHVISADELRKRIDDLPQDEIMSNGQKAYR